MLIWIGRFVSSTHKLHNGQNISIWKIFKKNVSVKFKYSERATHYCKIYTIDLSYVSICSNGLNLQWRFHKILWTSQNIWTLPTHLLCNSDIFLPTYAVKSIKQSHLFTCFGISFRKMRLYLIAVLFQASHLMANHPGNVFLFMI